jgi:hypothetical protein
MQAQDSRIIAPTRNITIGKATVVYCEIKQAWAVPFNRYHHSTKQWIYSAMEAHRYCKKLSEVIGVKN